MALKRIKALSPKVSSNYVPENFHSSTQRKKVLILTDTRKEVNYLLQKFANTLTIEQQNLGVEIRTFQEFVLQLYIRYLLPSYLSNYSNSSHSSPLEEYANIETQLDHQILNHSLGQSLFLYQNLSALPLTNPVLHSFNVVPTIRKLSNIFRKLSAAGITPSDYAQIIKGGYTLLEHRQKDRPNRRNSSLKLSPKDARLKRLLSKQALKLSSKDARLKRLLSNETQVQKAYEAMINLKRERNVVDLHDMIEKLTAYLQGKSQAEHDLISSLNGYDSIYYNTCFSRC